jgi:hypothetical protein
MRVASLMYSRTSSTCVQLASLESRTPSDAEIDRPLAQIAPKPASSTILALRPLWASIRKPIPGPQISWRSAAALAAETSSADGPVARRLLGAAVTVATPPQTGAGAAGASVRGAWAKSETIRRCLPAGVTGMRSTTSTETG